MTKSKKPFYWYLGITGALAAIGLLVKSEFVTMFGPAATLAFGGFLVDSAVYPKDKKGKGNTLIVYGILAGIAWLTVVLPIIYAIWPSLIP